MRPCRCGHLRAMRAAQAREGDPPRFGIAANSSSAAGLRSFRKRVRSSELYRARVGPRGLLKSCELRQADEVIGLRRHSSATWCMAHTSLLAPVLPIPLRAEAGRMVLRRGRNYRGGPQWRFMARIVIFERRLSVLVMGLSLERPVRLGMAQRGRNSGAAAFLHSPHPCRTPPQMTSVVATAAWAAARGLSSPAPMAATAGLAHVSRPPIAHAGSSSGDLPWLRELALESGKKAWVERRSRPPCYSKPRVAPIHS